MTHDKFCEGSNPRVFVYGCACDTINAIRQDEREKVAQEIRAKDNGTNLIWITSAVSIVRGDSK